MDEELNLNIGKPGNKQSHFFSKNESSQRSRGAGLGESFYKEIRITRYTMKLSWL